MKIELVDLETPLNSEDTESEEQKEKINVCERFKKTSILSQLFFIWVLPLFNLSKNKTLNFDNLTNGIKIPFNTNISQRHILIPQEKLNEYYYDKNKKTYHRLFLTILLANIKEITLVLILSLFLTLTRIGQIILLKKIIVIFEEPYNENFAYNLIFYSMILVVVKLSQIIVNHYNNYKTQTMCGNASSSLIGFIYSKLLVSSIFISEDFNKGKFINFIQNDAETVNFLLFYAPMTIVVPFQICMNIYMLFNLFGTSFLYSLVCFIFLVALAWFVEDFYIYNQRNLLSIKDDRIKVTNSILQMIKMIKMLSYEEISYNQIQIKRNIELNTMRKIQNIFVLSSFIHWVIPFALSAVSIGVHTAIYGHMKIENIIVAIEIYDSIAYPLYRLPIFITSLLNTLISMKRIEGFLNVKETHMQSSMNPENEKSEYALIYKDLNLGNIDSHKILLKNLNVEIKKGEFVGIIGETGSGKSCFVNSMLNYFEVIKKEHGGSDNSVFKINGSISYASQYPFIVNDTVKNNIIFYSEEDDDRYDKVCELCQLIEDIAGLPGMDFTEISCNGTNLSGGQKARINLARTIYEDADIYIFDDPISSVDPIVSNVIFQQVFLDFLKTKTRILCWNKLFGLNYMDKIIYFDNNEIIFNGTYDEFSKTTMYEKILKAEKIKQHDKSLKSLVKEDIMNPVKKSKTKTVLSIKKDSVEDLSIKKSNSSAMLYLQKGKLLNDKNKKGKIEEGKIYTYSNFFKKMGGNSYSLSIIILFLSILWQIFQVMNNYWLTRWSDANIKDANLLRHENSNLYFYLVYCMIGLLSLLFLFLREFLLTRGNILVSKILHNKMVKRIMKAPVNTFHDVIPLGQIINILNNDLEKCRQIVKFYGFITRGLSQLISSLIICYIFNKYSIIFVPMLFIAGFILIQYYIKCGRDIKKVECVSVTPIFSWYNETVNNIVSIRAFHKGPIFQGKFDNLVYHKYIISLYKNGLSNWYTLYLELSAFLYLVFIVIFSIIFRYNISPSAIGLLLKYSIGFCDQLLFFFDYIANLDNEMVHFERCENYTRLVHEKYKPKNSPFLLNNKKFEIHTPSIRFENYSARYRQNTDIILEKINIKIKAHTKIGIVGRSGSGKSSLINAIYRIIEPIKGKIYIDGIDTSKIPLSQLRSEMCIVPQEPFLFDSTIRFNIDPENKYSNLELITVLNKINFDFFKFGKKNILDMEIKGCNLSIGEKQLLCFARAILSKKKIVIFDEATANLDKQTEQVIYKCGKEYFDGCTILIIAHKIMNVKHCDKILVMDNGMVSEFDTPKNLYKKKDSIFRWLCDNDNIVI